MTCWITLLSWLSPCGMATLSVVENWVIPTHSESRFEPVSQEHNRPIVVGDLLYYATNQGEVVSLQRAEGYALWKISVGAGIHGSFSYGRSKLFVGDASGKLTAINAHDGSISWSKRIAAEWLSPPTVMRDKVCATSSSEDLYCFSERDGTELWHYSHRGDEKMTIRGNSSPTFFGDAVFVGFADGFVAALSHSDGKVLWAKRLRSRARFYDIDMPIFVDERGVLVATFDGNLYSLDRLNGEIQWNFPVGSHGGFLVEADRVFFSGLNGFVYALNRRAGTPIWKAGIESGIGLTPSRVGDHIVVATTADPMVLIKSESGEIVWTRSLGAGTYAAVGTSPSENLVYVLSNYGNLRSLLLAGQTTCRRPFDSVALPSVFWPHAAPPC